MLSLDFWTPMVFWLCSRLLRLFFLCPFSCFVLCFSSCLLFKDCKSQARDYPPFCLSCSVPSSYVLLFKLQLISNSTVLICTLWAWRSWDQQVLALIFYTRQSGFREGDLYICFACTTKNKCFKFIFFIKSVIKMLLYG